LINDFAENYTESEYSVDIANKISQKTGPTKEIINIVQDNFMDFDPNLSDFSLQAKQKTRTKKIGASSKTHTKGNFVKHDLLKDVAVIGMS